MNIINSDADNAVRQVVPQDFSFLSAADQQVVAALEMILRKIFGLNDNPIWCGEFKLVPAGVVNNVRQWNLQAGTILHKGKLYDVPKTICAGLNEDFTMRNSYLQLSESEVTPSPVYGDDGMKSISVHRQAVALGVTPVSPSNLPEGVYRLSDLLVLPKVVTQLRVNAVSL